MYKTVRTKIVHCLKPLPLTIVNKMLIRLLTAYEEMMHCQFGDCQKCDSPSYPPPAIIISNKSLRIQTLYCHDRGLLRLELSPPRGKMAALCTALLL